MCVRVTPNAWCDFHSLCLQSMTGVHANIFSPFVFLSFQSESAESAEDSDAKEAIVTKGKTLRDQTFYD